MYSCSKKLGAQLTTWGFSAFFVSLSIGVSIYPSISVVYVMGLVSLLGILRLVSNRTDAWQHVVWPLSNTFLSIVLVGRIGCWLAGCCFGEVSDLPWAVHYLNQGFASDYHFDRYQHDLNQSSLGVHPVQLYESFGLLLILRLSYYFKSRWGEISSACLSFASYLALYLLLIPFKAYLNNTSSLVYFGPLSLPQLVFGIVIIALMFIAYRFKGLVNELVPTKGQMERSLVKSISLSEGLILWISMSTAAGLSLSLGTPFSAQLSIIGVLLSALALVQMLHQGIKDFDDQNLSLSNSFEDEFSPKKISTWAFFVAIVPLSLFPLVIPNRADIKGPKNQITPRTWVYRLDPSSKKLLRIGRVDDFEPKKLEQLLDNENHTRARSCAGPNIYIH